MKTLFILLAFIASGCDDIPENPPATYNETIKDTIKAAPALELPEEQEIPKVYSGNHINTGTTGPGEIIAYAKTLIGTPYSYGSTNAKVGFDCSGFITRVFNHFNIAVPRSSIDFTNEGQEILLENAKAGDLVLFTGTDPHVRHVGHMGIITDNKDKKTEFIHSTSGKAYGVTITELNKYYIGRFVKVIRVFKENND
jgi:cell wall-associated NlpC family hydrolase